MRKAGVLPESLTTHKISPQLVVHSFSIFHTKDWSDCNYYSNSLLFWYPSSYSYQPFSLFSPIDIRQIFLGLAFELRGICCLGWEYGDWGWKDVGYFMRIECRNSLFYTCQVLFLQNMTQQTSIQFKYTLTSMNWNGRCKTNRHNIIEKIWYCLEGIKEFWRIVQCGNDKYDIIIQYYKMLSKICCYNTDISKCQCLGLTRNKTIKIGYLLIIALAYSILLIINAAMQSPSSQIIKTYNCQDENYKYQCVRNKNVEIIFGGVAVLHFILMCSMFCKSEKVKIINEGLWIIKILIAALVSLVLRLLVGTTFFQYLMVFSEWGANLLYLFIAIVFIDLVYAFDNYLDECAQENSKVYILKAIISITLILSAGFMSFLSFKHNPLFVSWTNVVLLVVFLIISLLRIFPGNSILVSSLISVCLGIIGFYVGGDDTSSEEYSPTLLVIKYLFVLFLLLGMLYQGSNKLRTRKSTVNELLALNTNASEDDNRYVSSNKWTVYHYIMIIITITIPAALSTWKTTHDSDRLEWLEYNNLTWWIGTIVFYIWSLVCSKLFPEKDFSDLENYFREYELQ